MKIRDYNLILSQFFLNFMKFNQNYKPNKILNTITYLNIYQITIFCILIP